MKKKIIIIGILIPFTAFLIFNITCIYKMWCMDSIIINDTSEYTNGTMTQYDGGSQAINFFPDYSELQCVNNIYFHYEDSRHKSNLYHEYFSVFILDVQYNESAVYEQMRNSFSKSQDHETTGDYLPIYENFDLENLCAKAIYCNDKAKTVRYVFIYGINAETDINALILWNSSYW